MVDLAKLVVSLEAESAKLRTELDKANNKLDRFGKRADSVTSGVSKSFKALGTAIAGLAIGAGFKSLVTSSLDAADQVQKLSQRLGASTEALSEYQHVAKLSGVDFKTLTLGWQRMTRRVAEAANGTGEAKDALRELGLSAKELNRLKPEKQFEVLADALIGVESPADRVRLAMKLFDSEGVSLIQTMQAGSKGIREMRDEAHSLGLTIDKDTADAAARANDAMTRLAASGEAAGVALAAGLAPTIEAMATWFGENVPSAIQITADAFATLQEYASNFMSWLTGALGDAEHDLAGIADFFGADDLAASFRSAGDSYRQMADNWAVSSGEIKKSTIDVAKVYKTAAEEGASYQDIYRKAIQDQLAAERAASEKRKAGLTDEAKAAQKAAEQLKSFADQLRRTYNPAQDLAEQLDNIEKALDAGYVSWDVYGDAVLDAMDKMEKASEGAKEQAEKTKSITEELGMTFNSAFEDAVVNGENLGDVLKSLEKDLVRILARKWITEPLGEFASGLDLGSMLSFDGGGFTGYGSRVGGVDGKGGFLSILHPNETVEDHTKGGAPARSVTVNMNITTQDADSFRRSSRQIAQDLRLAVGNI